MKDQKQNNMSDYKCIKSFHTDEGSYFGYGSIINYSRYQRLPPKYKKNFVENDSYVSSSNTSGRDDGFSPSSPIDYGSDSSSSCDSSSSSDSSSFDFGGGDTGGGGASGDW